MLFHAYFQFSLSHWAQKAAGHEDHTAGLGHECRPLNCTVNITYSLTFALHICILPRQAPGTRLPLCDSFLLSTFLIKPSVIGLFTNFGFQEWKLSIKFVGNDFGTDTCYELMLLISCQMAQTLRVGCTPHEPGSLCLLAPHHASAEALTNTL